MPGSVDTGDKATQGTKGLIGFGGEMGGGLLNTFEQPDTHSLFNTLSKEKFNLSITNNKLKSTNVNAIAIDQNDYVWVGSDEGLIYFTTSKFDDIKNYDTKEFRLFVVTGEDKLKKKIRIQIV